MKSLLALQLLVFLTFFPVTAEILPASSHGNRVTVGVEGQIPNYPFAVNSKNFYAQGYGVSDDIAALRAAIDTCSLNSAVHFPVQSYLATSTIVDTKSIAPHGAAPDVTNVSSAVGDSVGETKAKMRFGLSLGFGGSGIHMKKAKYTDTIYFKKYGSYNDDPDTLVPDFSKYGTAGFVPGFSISIDLYKINHSNFFTGFNVTFGGIKDGLSSALMDWRFGYEIPIIKDRFFLPVGFAGTFGRCSFEIDYAQELQSHLSDFHIGVEESTYLTTVRAATYGACLFSGLRIALQNNIGVYGTIGYRYHDDIDTWKGSDRFYEWDAYSGEYVSGLNEYKIAEKWLPFRDVRFAGVDIHAGIAWVW